MTRDNLNAPLRIAVVIGSVREPRMAGPSPRGWSTSSPGSTGSTST
ncbi:hypothetical protein ACFQ0B_48750 [Nonomuraea thailandensis]